MAQDVMKEREAKTEHFQYHCRGRAKRRSACQGIWYRNDKKSLSPPRGCLLNHYNNRDLLRDTRTRGGGLGENTKTLPTQTQESLFCQFFSLGVFIDGYNVYNGYFSGPGRKIFGQNWKEKCDLAFSLSSPSRSGQDEMTSLQVNMNLHGNYWHRRDQRMGHHPPRPEDERADTQEQQQTQQQQQQQKKKKKKKKNQQSRQNLCRWYCPRQRWKEWAHLNENFSQQFLAAVFISASTDKTYHGFDSHLWAEQASHLAWPEDFWPRIGARIKAMSHSATCQTTLHDFCQTFYERLCEQVEKERSSSSSSPNRPTCPPTHVDLTLQECDFALACQFWPRWCEASKIQEYLLVRRRQQQQQQARPNLFDPRQHKVWRKMLMKRDEFGGGGGGGGHHPSPFQQFRKQMNFPPTPAGASQTRQECEPDEPDCHLLDTSSPDDGWSSGEKSSSSADDFERDIQLKKIKLSMSRDAGGGWYERRELAHTCHRQLEFVQKPVQLQTHSPPRRQAREEAAAAARTRKEAYWLLLEKEIRHLQVWADFFLPRDFRYGTEDDGPGFPAASSAMDALIDKCHDFVRLGCPVSELCFGVCLAILQLVDSWLDLRRDCLRAILAQAGSLEGPGADLDVQGAGLAYPIDAELMVDFAERIDQSLYTDENTQRGDRFKRELARDLTRASPGQLKFFFTTFSECELFHVRHCPIPAVIRQQFLRQLGEFLRASCHDLDLAGGGGGGGPALDNEHWINSYLFDLSSASLTESSQPPQLQHRSIKSYLAQCFPLDSVVNMDKDFILNRNRLTQGEFTRYICRRIPNLLDQKFQADLAGVVSIVSGRTDASPLSSGLPRSHWGFCQSKSRITYESLGNFTRFQSFLSQSRVYEREDRMAAEEEMEVDDDGAGASHHSMINNNNNNNNNNYSHSDRSSDDDPDLTSDPDSSLSRRKLTRDRARQAQRNAREARRQRRDLIAQVQMTRPGQGGRRPGLITPSAEADPADPGHVYLSSSAGENEDEKELIRKINRRDKARDEDRASRRKVYDKYFKPSLVKKLGDRERTLLKNSFDDDKCSSLSLIYFSFLVNFCGLHGFKIMHAALFFNKPYLNEYLYKIVNARWNIRHDPQMALKSMVLKTVRERGEGMSAPHPTPVFFLKKKIHNFTF